VDFSTGAINIYLLSLINILEELIRNERGSPMARLRYRGESLVVPWRQVADIWQTFISSSQSAKREVGSAGLALVLCLGAVVAVGGCGERRVEVSGKVTVDGKPLISNACTIMFAPDKGNPLQKIPSAPLDEKGSYRISTGGQDGIPPGWYRVYVAFDARQSKGKPPPFHPKYLDAAKSPLSIEVVANPQPGAYDLDLGEK
jgi:hypothetical protein